MRDYRFFVYMLNSRSRRALYTGMTNCIIGRVNQHRAQETKRSFTAQYRAYRLVYYEEFDDIHACIRREKEIKGWTRAKKNALVNSMNPKWRDLLTEWEEKYGFDFIVPIPAYGGEQGERQQQQPQKQQQLQSQKQPPQKQRQLQSQKQPQGPSSSSLRSSAQDDMV